jgi:hypothetical protein
MGSQKGRSKKVLGVIGIAMVIWPVVQVLIALRRGIDLVPVFQCFGVLLVAGTLLTLIGFDVIRTDHIWKALENRFGSAANKLFGTRKRARKWLVAISASLCIPCAFYGATYFWTTVAGDRAWASWDSYVIVITGILFAIGMGVATLREKL